MKKYVNLLNLTTSKNAGANMARLALLKYDEDAGEFVRDVVPCSKPTGRDAEGKPTGFEDAETSTIEVPLGALQARLYKTKGIVACDAVIPTATEETYQDIFTLCEVDLTVTKREAGSLYTKPDGTTGILKGTTYDYNITDIALLEGVENVGDSVFATARVKKSVAASSVLAARLDKKKLLEQEEADKAKKVEKK